jgi:hypothetical protein
MIKTKQLLAILLLNYSILACSSALENVINEKKLRSNGKINYLERLYSQALVKVRREDQFESNKGEVINDLIKEKLMERLKSLYVVTTRSRWVFFSKENYLPEKKQRINLFYIFKTRFGKRSWTKKKLSKDI